ncbi:MAG: tRNA epoxyqueuosine(34) reductase QueG [Cyanobacteria bacterium P01_D01_bin.156]
MPNSSQNLTSTPLIERLEQQSQAVGFHRFGVVAVAPEPTAPEQTMQTRLRQWLHQGYQADMDWMANPKRENIRRVMPDVCSIICVALNYYTPHQRPEGEKYGKIARYGWGRDYHRVMHKKLKQLCLWLQSQSHPQGGLIAARYYADTGPVQDKFWAQQAGLGWVAKNGNLITRNYGSWVFLGEILTNVELPASFPHTSHCGTCTRCLDACPTQAIRAPGVIDANRCIAYHTIENRTEQLPKSIVDHLDNWVAGCDVCQDVCPWNQRFAQPTDVKDFDPYPDNVAPQLNELSNLTKEDWDRRFPASALRRIKPAMWRRNAKAVLEHSQGKPAQT